MKKLLLMMIVFVLLTFCQVSAQKKGNDKILPNPPKAKTTQKIADEDSTALSSLIISSDYLYNMILVVNKKGEVKNGFFVGVDSSGIYFLFKGKTEKLDLDELSYIKISRTRKYSGHGLTGGLWGMWLGNIMFWQAKGQPTVYLRDYGRSEDFYGFLAADLAFAAAGIGLGYLAGALFERKDATYQFSGNTISRKKELNRMIDAVKGTTGVSKYHLSIYTSQVNSRGTDDFKNMITEYGLKPSSYYYDYYYTSDNSVLSNINLLRKLQFTYSLYPDLDFGLAVNFLGIPDIYAARSGYYSNSGTRVNGIFHATGYNAVAVYSPLKKFMPEDINWTLGCGLGLVNVDYSTSFSLDTTIYMGGVSKAIYEHQTSYVKKTLVSMELFSDIVFNISSAATLGFNLDYMLVPQVTFPKMVTQSSGTIRKFTVSPGGFSFGISLGFYY